MALPKLSTPSFELTLPSTGKKIKYRPFLVKEHKTLLLLKDSSDEDVIRILEEVVDVCTFNKLKISDLPSFDVEYIFTQIRAKSIGESVDFSVNCDCGNAIPERLNLLELKVDKDPSHTSKIQITDGIGVEMRYPKFRDVISIFASGDRNTIMDLVLECVKGIYTTDGDYHEITHDNKDELIEFIESMNQDQFERIENFFKTMPRMRHKVTSHCDKCGKDNHAVLEGLQIFFV